MEGNDQILLLLGRIDQRTQDHGEQLTGLRNDIGQVKEEVIEVKIGVSSLTGRVTSLEQPPAPDGDLISAKGVMLPSWMIRPLAKWIVGLLAAAGAGGVLTKWLSAGQAAVSAVTGAPQP